MIEVEITNYESIAHAKVVIDGFTTIVGRNALGKSATLRAINAALTNQQGTHFIRWGEQYCEVRLKIDDLDIIWHKEEGNNFYQINGGERYTKIGKDEPPKEITGAGFKLIKVGDQKINLNYTDQFTPLFLVDKQDSKGADLLTSVYGLDRLYKAIDLCNKAQRENTDELRMREKDLELVNKDLERFKNFDKAKSSAADLKSKKSELDDLDTSLQDLKNKLGRIQELAVLCRRLQTVKSVTIPNPSEIRDGVSDYKRLVQYQESISKLTEVLKRLKGIASIELPVETSPKIIEMLSGYKNLCAWYARHDALSKEVARLSKVSEIKIPKETIDSDTIEKLRRYSTEIDRQKKELLAAKDELGRIVKEHSEVSAELNKFEVCPLCKKPR